MGIKSIVELPRRAEYELGKGTTARRQFVAILDDNTLEGNPLQDFDLVGVATPTFSWGSLHPGLPWLRLRKLTTSERYEGDPYKALIEADYGLIRDEELVFPADRPAVWASQSSAAEVPTLYYYSGSGNGTRLPLTNSAYDYYQGLTTTESMVRFTVTKNFGPAANADQNTYGQFFPYTQAASINHLNNGDYGGAVAHSFKVQSVNISFVQEEFSAKVAKYWQMTAEIMFRQTGWNLQLPDVGFNFLDGGQKRRAMVFDFQNGEWVASPNPVGLNGSGAQTGGAPAILERRVLPEANFTSIFGAMPS